MRSRARQYLTVYTEWYKLAIDIYESGFPRANIRYRCEYNELLYFCLTYSKYTWWVATAISRSRYFNIIDPQPIFYTSNGVAIAVFSTSSGAIGIWWYARTRSIFKIRLPWSSRAAVNTCRIRCGCSAAGSRRRVVGLRLSSERHAEMMPIDSLMVVLLFAPSPARILFTCWDDRGQGIEVCCRREVRAWSWCGVPPHVEFFFRLKTGGRIKTKNSARSWSYVILPIYRRCIGRGRVSPCRQVGGRVD